jgi:putative ABC transport system substrate-binding protein
LKIIKPKWFLLINLTLLFFLVFINNCAHKEKVYKIGILTSFSPMLSIANGFKAGMFEMDYIEGENIFYDIQIKDADPEGEKQAVKKFIDDNVDLIFTFPTEASVIAFNGTKGTKIPVVFAMCGIEGNIPIESVSHPGEHATGVRFPGPDNVIKHLELILELNPDAKNIWVTYNPKYPNTPIMLNTLYSAALNNNVTIIEAPNLNAEEVQADLDALNASVIDAFLLLPESLSQSRDVVEVIIKYAIEHKILVGGGVPYTLELGAVFCLTPDEFEMGRLAAPVANKILNGIPPGEIPLVTPENYLWLNYKVAKKLGLNVSEGLLARVDKIIK